MASETGHKLCFYFFSVSLLHFFSHMRWGREEGSLPGTPASARLWNVRVADHTDQRKLIFSPVTAPSASAFVAGASAFNWKQVETPVAVAAVSYPPKHANTHTHIHTHTRTHTHSHTRVPCVPLCITSLGDSSLKQHSLALCWIFVLTCQRRWQRARRRLKEKEEKEEGEEEEQGKNIHIICLI